MTARAPRAQRGSAGADVGAVLSMRTVFVWISWTGADGSELL